jgi:hypothetical protein
VGWSLTDTLSNTRIVPSARPVTVRLYNPRTGDETNHPLQVNSATVDPCADAACA